MISSISNLHSPTVSADDRPITTSFHEIDQKGATARTEEPTQGVLSPHVTEDNDTSEIEQPHTHRAKTTECATPLSQFTASAGSEQVEKEKAQDTQSELKNARALLSHNSSSAEDVDEYIDQGRSLNVYSDKNLGSINSVYDGNDSDNDDDGGNGSEYDDDNDEDDDDDADDADDELERIGRFPNLEQLRIFANTHSSQLPQLPDIASYTTRLQTLYHVYSRRVRQAASDRSKSFQRPFPAFWPENEEDDSDSQSAISSSKASISEDIERIESMSATETLREILNLRPLDSMKNFRLFPMLHWDEYESQGSGSDAETAEVFKPIDVKLCAKDLAPTFHLSGSHGCPHYQRNCKIQCVTCEKWYTCRLCHDEVESHNLPRHETRHMLCTLCGVPQRAAQICGNCHEYMAEQYCDICKLWSTNLEKHMFHCNACGICRVGQGLGIDTFHCTTCDTCMDLDLENNHTCIEKSTHGNCPICQVNLFNSRSPIVFLRCGHALHNDCYESLIELTYKCPICSKAIVDTSAINRIIDDEIEHEVLPQEYACLHVDVRCLECRGRSRIPFHFAGLKCSICHSYNTTRI